MSIKSDLNAMFEYAYAQSEKRAQHRKLPVIVESRLFSSITDAAYWIAKNRRDLWEGSKAANEQDAHRVMRNLISRVRNWCYDYTERGIVRQQLLWCIAEDGAPETWTVRPGVNGEDNWLLEDLRK